MMRVLHVELTSVIRDCLQAVVGTFDFSRPLPSLNTRQWKALLLVLLDAISRSAVALHTSGVYLTSARDDLPHVLRDVGYTARPNEYRTFFEQECQFRDVELRLENLHYILKYEVE